MCTSLIFFYSIYLGRDRYLSILAIRLLAIDRIRPAAGRY